MRVFTYLRNRILSAMDYVSLYFSGFAVGLVPAVTFYMIYNAFVAVTSVSSEIASL